MNDVEQLKARVAELEKTVRTILAFHRYHWDWKTQWTEEEKRKIEIVVKDYQAATNVAIRV